MRNRMLMALCGTTALCATHDAAAVYTGLSVVGTLVQPAGLMSPRMMYRVYANFTDLNDYVVNVLGSPTGSTLVIESRNQDDTAAGSNFFNPVNWHGTAPTPVDVFGGTDPKTIPIPPVANAEYDTFFTIGVGAGQLGSGQNGANETGNQGAPNNFIPGNSFSNNNCGWFTNGPVEQGRAGWQGDGDSALRVLIMQLTVSSTSNVRGTLNIAGENQIPLSGGQTFVLSGQTFNSVPGPGPIACLAIAAAWGRRRRGHMM